MGVYLTKMNTTTNKVEKFKVASNGAIYNNTEVVYDMTSPNANINWGYTSGIRNNITVTGKDFSKYEKLIAYCYTNYYTYPVEIDLTKHTVENFYLGRLCIGKADSMLYFAGGQTNLEKTSFTARIFRVNPATNMSNEYDEDSFYVYKIEGVLKTPSMIYTGKELNAGDGISLNNGIISQKQRCSVNISGFNDVPYSSPGGTTEGVVISGTFTKYDEASSLLISYASSSFYVTGGGSAYCKVSIDDINVGYSDVITNSSNETHSISKTVIVTNISAGNHSFKWTCWSDASNRKANIAAYNTFSIAIQEI